MQEQDMPKYSVDVKAFISVEVEAPDEATARAAADLFVENLSPTNHYIAGYSGQLKEFGEPAIITENTASFDVDGESEVMEVGAE
jgi:hypothetical protein